MDTSRFNKYLDSFSLFGLAAHLEYKTTGSICFLVGEGPPATLWVRGRLEVHSPCDGGYGRTIGVRIRGFLPKAYLNAQSMAEVVKTLYSVLSIPEEEPHKARFSEYAWRPYVVQDLQVVAYSPG